MMDAPNRPGLLLRDIAAVLGVIAILLRGMVAPGLMPDLAANADGDFKLVICSSGGLKALLPGSDSDGDESPAGHGGLADLCPFAASGHLATLTEPLALMDLPVRFAFDTAAPEDAAIAPAIRNPRARAPPHLS